ncbi:hypothetical protein EJB05_32170, partial [Eragrostis curvula]
MELQQSKRGRKEEQEDRLSGLPNDLLHSILHDLPLKDAVGTSRISHQWETMWLDAIATSRILDFTDRDFVRRAPAQVTAMVSLCLKRQADQAVRWVVDAVARGAKEVEVDLTPAHGHGAAQLDTDGEGFFVELPGDLFLARNSLVRLALDRFSIGAVPLSAAGLTGLRSLSLNHANVTDEEVEAVLSSCLLLEFLSLRSCHLLASVRIIGDKLRCLKLVNCLEVLELRVAAPSLESFVFYGDVVCLTDEDDDNDDNHIATVDLGTTPALRDAYLSHMLAEDMSERNLGIDMTKVQELQLLMEFLGFADIQSIASLFLHNPLPLLDRLFIHILGDPSEEGREAASLPGELIDDRDIFIYDDGIVLGQLKLVKVVNLQGTRLEIVLLAFLAKRAPALEQLVLVTAEEEQGGPGDELVKIIQGHVRRCRRRRRC